MNMSFEIGRNPGPSCHTVLTTTPDFQSWEAVPQFCIVHGILIDCLEFGVLMSLHVAIGAIFSI